MSKDIVRRFFAGTGHSYETVVNLFTYGADRYWKRRMLEAVPVSGAILDLACGTGIVTFQLHERQPQCKIVGVDMMQEYLARAQQKLRQQRARRIHLICARAEQVKLKSQFDCIISSYIPKYVPAETLLANIAPNLKTGGILILHDFAYPTHSILRRLWHGHMALLRVLGPGLFPEWKTVFRELSALVQTTNWIEEYRVTLNAYGFGHIRVRRYTAGSAAIISAVKR